MRLIHTLLLAALLANLINLSALAAPPSLSLPEAMAMALERHPLLGAGRARVEAAEGQVREAGLIPNPNFVTDNGIAEDTYRYGLQYRFEVGPKRSRRIRVARIQKTVSTARLGNTRTELMARVRATYCRLYFGQARLGILEELQASGRKLADIARRREAEGKASRMDILRAEMDAAKLSREVLSLQENIAGARHELAYLIRGEVPESVVLDAPPAPSAVLTRSLEQALRRRDDYQALLRQQQAARARKRLQEALRIPDVTISAGSDILTAPKVTHNAFITGQIELPVFDRNQGEIQSLEAEAVALSLEADDKKHQIRRDLETLIAKLTILSDKLDLFEKHLLPTGRELMDKTRKGYELGKLPIDQAVRSRQEYLKLQNEYLDVRLARQLALSRLDRITGEHYAAEN